MKHPNPYKVGQHIMLKDEPVVTGTIRDISDNGFSCWIEWDEDGVDGWCCYLALAAAMPIEDRLKSIEAAHGEV